MLIDVWVMGWGRVVSMSRLAAGHNIFCRHEATPRPSTHLAKLPLLKSKELTGQIRRGKCQHKR